MSIGKKWSSTMKNKLGLALLTLLISLPAAASWELAAQDSKLNIVSVKNAVITETHQFDRLDGGLMDNGEFSLIIDLASINTGIEIRDTRMRDLLFKVGDYPRAVITAKLDLTQVNALQPGQITKMEATFDLNLHGKHQSMSAEVTVVATQDHGLLVNSVSPVVLRAEDFGLTEGINSLREIAGLANINTMVPVTFTLLLNKV